MSFTNNTTASDIASVVVNAEETKMIATSNDRWDDFRVDSLTKEILRPIAEFAIPNTFDRLNEKELYLDCINRQTAFVDFCKENAFQPIPLPEAMIVVFTKEADQIPDNWLGCLKKLAALGLGTTFIAAVRHKGKLEQVDISEMGCFQKVKLAKYDVEKHVEIATFDNNAVGNFVAQWQAREIDKLSPEAIVKLAQIINPTFSKATPEVPVLDTELVITRHNNRVVFNLETRELFARQEYVAAATIAIGAEKVSSKFALFSLAMMAVQPGYELGTINDKLNQIPNLFERDPRYGVTMEADGLEDLDPTRVVMDNSILPLNFVERDPNGKRNDEFPWVLPVNDKFDLGTFSLMLSSGKAAMIDKYGLQFAAGEEAANAALIGRCKDTIYTLHDAGKVSKLYNRPTQARKHLKAEQPQRVASSFAAMLPNGKLARQRGRKLATLLTNSRLTFGSGPAILNPSVKFTTSVKKTMPIKVVYNRLSLAQREELETIGGKKGDKNAGMTAMQEILLDQIQESIENKTVFNTGDVMLSYQGMAIAINSAKNQSLMIANIKRCSAISLGATLYSNDYFTIFLTVDLCVEDSWFKLRNDGFKLTTIPYEVEVIDEETGKNVEYEIILNNETQKGFLCRLILFVVAHDGAVYHPNEATLEMKDGTLIDLTDKDNEVNTWVKANTRVGYITLDMAKIEWEMLKAYGPVDDIELIWEKVNTVRVRERVEYLAGHQFYEVEISTPRESTSLSGFTPEQLAAISIQNDELAESINAESTEYRSAVIDLVDMITRKDLSEIPHVDVRNSEHRALVKTAIGDVVGLNDRQLLNKYLTVFPNGVVFCTNNAEGNRSAQRYINFNVVSKMSAFVGNSAKDLAEDTVAILNYLAAPDASGAESRVNSLFTLLNQRLKGWLRANLESKGVLKRVARTKKIAINGKIRTSYCPMLNHKAGELPKVGINQKCAILKELAKGIDGKFDPQFLNADGKLDPRLMNGMIVGGGRTPMPFLGCFELVVVPSKFCGIGHIIMLPHVWAMCNEGDSDG